MMTSPAATTTTLVMGGTSTDVSHYDGEYEHVFESSVAGVSIQAPQVGVLEWEIMGHGSGTCVNAGSGISYWAGRKLVISYCYRYISCIDTVN